MHNKESSRFFFFCFVFGVNVCHHPAFDYLPRAYRIVQFKWYIASDSNKRGNRDWFSSIRDKLASDGRSTVKAELFLTKTLIFYRL